MRRLLALGATFFLLAPAWAAEYHDNAKLADAVRSVGGGFHVEELVRDPQGRPVWLVRGGSDNPADPAVLVVAGVDGRHLVGTEMALAYDLAPSYGYFNPEDAVEIVNYRLTARARHEVSAQSDPARARADEPAVRGYRDVYFAGDGPARTRIIDRGELLGRHGAVVERVDAGNSRVAAVLCLECVERRGRGDQDPEHASDAANDDKHVCDRREFRASHDAGSHDRISSVWRSTSRP